jgi:hypothetical protein
MKKVITLLLIVSTVASASAQTSQEESRRVVLGTGGGDTRTERTSGGSNPVDVILGRDRRVEDNQGTRYPSGTYGTREQQIDRVNREYDAKIYSIRNNRTLTAAEKERMIRQLEADRARRIREINNRYYDRDSRYDDDNDNYRKDKKYKTNNGNHYGWEKGKGNPHKSGNYSKGNGKGKGKS